MTPAISSWGGTRDIYYKVSSDYEGDLEASNDPMAAAGMAINGYMGEGDDFGNQRCRRYGLLLARGPLARTSHGVRLEPERWQ